MIYMCLYTLGMLVITIQVGKRKRANIVTFICAYYLFISVMSIVGERLGLQSIQGIRLWPYVLILFSVSVLLFPYRGRQFDPNKIDYEISDPLLMVVVLCALISNVIKITALFSTARNLISANEWAHNRVALYRGEITVIYSSNRIIQSIVVLGGYFTTASLIVYFYLLTQEKKPFLRISLLVSTIVATFLNAVIYSARGTLFNFLILLFGMYLFFKDGITIELKRKLKLILLLSLSVGTLFAVVVTASRFDSALYGKNSELYSVIRYFGVSPITFSARVPELDRFSFGAYAFDYLLASDFSASAVGVTWGSSFFTYLGWLYMDWGAVGIIIFTILVFLLSNLLVRQSRYNFATIYYFFFFFEFMLQGALVIGRNYIYTLIAFVLQECAFIFLEHTRFGLRRINR